MYKYYSSYIYIRKTNIYNNYISKTNGRANAYGFALWDFCKVIENGNFTKVAKEVGYSQSAISQSIKALEQELGTILIDRKKEGITLTDDGKSFYPYIQAIFHAELSLKQKQQEMKGLEHSVIRIGTFTSVSRNILPQLMKNFKSLYPTVNFVLNKVNIQA